ncbi:OmpA family protein [Leucothrix arctica]|nr:OmpA family protein [Leucothrix arctica]
MVDTQEDENSLFEYLITGLVILFFGGLYYFINHVGDDATGQPIYAVSSSSNANAATAALSTAGVVSADVSDKPDVKQASDDTTKADTTQVAEGDSAGNAVKLATTNTDQQKADEANQQAIAALAAEKAKLLGEVTALRSDRDELIATNDELIVEAEAVIKQLSTTKQAAAPQPALAQSTKAQSAQTEPQAAQTNNAGLQSYQLPDGTAVNVTDQGFEGLLKQALEVRATNTPIIFDAIYFESGASEPTKNSQSQITATAALMNGYPEVHVLIKGHTDGTGDSRNNTLLSLTRSSYMKNALVKLGIDARRINVQGVGSLEPIAPNDTEEGRNANRRIELILND